MKYQTMSNILETNKKLKFKLYSLEYLIVKEASNVLIYILDSKIKKSYNSFEELMNNYLVYQESLLSQIDRIEILNN